MTSKAAHSGGLQLPSETWKKSLISSLTFLDSHGTH